jgi:hypothetical protein
LFHLVFESHDGRALGADSEEKHEPVSDIDTVPVDSLKALDPKRPIREADIRRYPNAKTRFQSFFMLITVQPFFLASS